MSNLAPQTNLKIAVLWRKWRNNCTGKPCEDEISVFADGGWHSSGIALSLYISAAPAAGSDINMTDLTTETSSPPLSSSPQSPPSPNSQPVLHQQWAATKDQHTHCRRSVQSSSPSRWASSLPPVSSHPTPYIPISLTLNGPCVPLNLERLTGWSRPPVPLNGFFLNVHTLWPAALYSNCVNKTSNGEGHKRRIDVP